ncbi:hypothetical protein J4573_03125 [Actinomadura barringtoniae]|uniref:Membrane-associated oxidoreductase n=1 Tax=Actinomadura barringtoniae TaxID=1427535 RepID=A0A939P621_9ACTN|nr:hypothetical protein [Actinomadura barringtoniae]MBO2446066.1 hypothetical protein [Actinomadura barringtoniae]
MLEDLSEPEQRLSEAFSRGEPLDLRTGDPAADDPAHGSGWGPERTVRAELLASLLRDATVAERGNPRGLRLIGARVTGGLSLDFAEVACVVVLTGCWFEERPTAEWARLRSFDLSGSALPGLNADSAEFDGHLRLDRCQARDCLDLGAAQVKGDLFLRGADLADVNAERLHIGGSLRGRGLKTHGDLCLDAARIGGSADLADATFANPGETALQAARLGVEGDLCLDGGVVRGRIRLGGATIGGDLLARSGFTAEGSLYLRGARIGGLLDLSGASLAEDDDHALQADRLTCEGGVLCRNLTARGGARFVDADLSTVLDLAGARLSSTGQAPFDGSALTVRGPLLCDKGFVIDGAMILAHAGITGDMILDDAVLTNPGGEALPAHSLTVGGGLRARRASVEGTIVLRTARITGDLTIADATLDAKGADGPVLGCTDIEIGGALMAKDATVLGEIMLAGGTVKGVVNLIGARLAHPGGIALRAEQARITELHLRPRVPIEGGIDLRNARLGALRDAPDSYLAAAAIHLDGMTFDALDPATPVRQRLRLLKRTGGPGPGSGPGSGPAYLPQPYEQLASAYRRLGHDAEARKVLLAKQRRRRATLGPLGRIWGWLQDVTVGYGYQPLLPALWLIALLAAGTLAFALDAPRAAERGKGPEFNPFLYTLDLLLPIIDFGQEKAFAPSGVWQWLAAVLIAAGWILATTVLAGMTRALSRSTA